MLTISFEVTERVQVERELSELKLKCEAKYQTLFEFIDEGICIIEMLYNEDDQFGATSDSATNRTPQSIDLLETRHRLESHSNHRMLSQRNPDEVMTVEKPTSRCADSGTFHQDALIHFMTDQYDDGITS